MRPTSGARLSIEFVHFLQQAEELCGPAPVKALDTENNRFQVGSDSSQLAGYAAFVRSTPRGPSRTSKQPSRKGRGRGQACARSEGRVQAGQGLLDDKDWPALCRVRESLPLGLESLDLHYELGFAYYKTGNPKKAKEHYGTILEADARDTDVRYNLARIYEKEKDWDSAIREYQAILKFDPDDQTSRDRLNLLKTAREMQQ